MPRNRRSDDNSSEVERHDPIDRCTIPLGTWFGAPIRLHFIVLVTWAGCLIKAAHQYWHNFSYQNLSILLLFVGAEMTITLFCILVHEYGHGLTATALGGKMTKILLWPFGGICFHKHPKTQAKNQRLGNELKISFGGPATHLVWIAFFFGALFLVFWRNDKLDLFRTGWWRLPLPFLDVLSSETCVWVVAKFQSTQSILFLCFFNLLLHLLQINIILFFFNVFLPLPPMDGAKLLASGLQICGVREVTSAYVVIVLGGSLACGVILYIAYSFFSPFDAASGFSNLIMGVIVVQGLSELWHIHQMIRGRILHKSYMFQCARSPYVWDSRVRVWAANPSNFDDETGADAPIYGEGSASQKSPSIAEQNRVRRNYGVPPTGGYRNFGGGYAR